MSVIDTLIFDRSEFDLLYETDKSFYNFEDFNRIGHAQQYIQKALEVAGYDIDISPKIDWKEGDEPTATDLNQYIYNLNILRQKYYTFVNTPATPEDFRFFTIEQANNIERILVDLDTILQRMRKSYKYSNQYMFYAGNDPLPIDVAEYVLRTSDGKIIRSSDGYVFIVR